MPHFVWDRQKPGVIAVNRAGRRFVNEARSYHEFVQAMIDMENDRANSPAFLLCDSATLRKWGLGLVHAGHEPRFPLIRDGYLFKAGTVRGLARKLGIDATGLAETVARYNSFVREGVDRDFQKGSDTYQCHLGDPDLPAPNLGPISRPPYYGIRIEPGVIGTAFGLKTDGLARVLRTDGTAVPGLYACGNDMGSIMGGTYPGPGITLGPAMTFGFVAASHIAEELFATVGSKHSSMFAATKGILS